jgi:hypothetical protein
LPLTLHNPIAVGASGSRFLLAEAGDIKAGQHNGSAQVVDVETGGSSRVLPLQSFFKWGTWPECAPDAYKSAVGEKGGPGSGFYGHAGRPGKQGGSAPSSEAPTAGHTTARAKYERLEDMPCFKQYGNVREIPHQENGPAEDAYLKAMLHDQGFDGKPDVVSKEELDGYVTAGEVELFRGINGDSTKPDLNRKYAEYYARDFRSGEMYVGRGDYGDGVYAAARDKYASLCAGKGGKILRMTLKADAKVIALDEVAKQREAARAEAEKPINALRRQIDEMHMERLRQHLYDVSPEMATLQNQLTRAMRDVTERPEWMDNGRWAASHGYDAILVPKTSGGDFYIILNRTALRVQDKNHRYEVKQP